VPDPRWGEAVKALVVAKDPSNPPNSQELINFCKAGIASYKKPREIVLVAEIPKGQYGKISRKLLREIFSDRESADNPRRERPAN